MNPPNCLFLVVSILILPQHFGTQFILNHFLFTAFFLQLFLFSKIVIQVKTTVKNALRIFNPATKHKK